MFQQCVIVTWLDKTYPYPHTGTFDKTPLMIASVNRHWRNVALSTPRLWSALTLALRSKYAVAKKQRELASLWLSHSGNSYLSLHIETHTDIYDAMPKMMQILASQSERWRHIYFKLPLPMLKGLSSVQSRLPMLKILKIELWDHIGSASAAIDFFAHAPRLRDFNAGEHVTEKSLTIPWNQLRNLNIRPFNPRSPYRIKAKTVLDLLALASDVEHIEFQVAGSSATIYTQPPCSVHLQNLSSLVAVFGGLDPIPFIANLHMPVICELSLATSRSWESLRPLWTSLCSQSTLEKLALQTLNSNLTGIKLHDRDVVHILEDLKQLRVLEVLDSEPAFISPHFLERFAQRSTSGSPILAPNLQTLLFCQSGFRYASFDSFTRALQSRYPPGSEAMLRTITILCPERHISSILETFQTSSWWNQLRDMGIDMQLQATESYALWW